MHVDIWINRHFIVTTQFSNIIRSTESTDRSNLRTLGFFSRLTRFFFQFVTKLGDGYPLFILHKEEGGTII
jgi:hypothetical protein